MAIGKAVFSSARMDWETPASIFDPLDKEFGFTLDVCANEKNAKCDQFFSPSQDGLSMPWGENICWMNPPYGRQIISWVEKAFRESLTGATVVTLLPARTDTQWFHRFVYHKAELRFVEGRVTFVGAGNSAPFPSMIVVWRPKSE